MIFLRMAFILFFISALLAPVAREEKDGRSMDSITRAPETMTSRCDAFSIRRRIERKYSYPELVFWEKPGADFSLRKLRREYFLAETAPSLFKEWEHLEFEAESQRSEESCSKRPNALESQRRAFQRQELNMGLRTKDMLQQWRRGKFRFHEKHELEIEAIEENALDKKETDAKDDKE